MAGLERSPTLEYAMKLKTLACLSLITLVASLGLATQAQTFTVIHAFNGDDGAFPMAGVTLRGGNLYGTTSNGGAPYARGNVYVLSHSGDNWDLQSLYIFPQGGIQGANAIARPVFGPDGHLYGSTNMGGNVNGGLVFRLTPPLSICKTANCFWTNDVLYAFEYDLACPSSGDLIWDQQGNIYGTAECGGMGGGGVYELSLVGNTWMETSIYIFQGYATEAGVIFDKTGNLFGSTYTGGANNGGAIYELKYVSGVGWAENVIYSFSNSADGPPAAVTFDTSGNLFGVTYGDYMQEDGGAIFELSPKGDT